MTTIFTYQDIFMVLQRIPWYYGVHPVSMEIQWYFYDYYSIVSQNAVISYYSYRYFREYSGITIVQVQNSLHYHAIVQLA